MTGKPEPDEPNHDIAKPAEIRAAIEALTVAESNHLRQSAHHRIRGLGRKAMGWTADDLLQEAVTATLEGRRRWKSRVVDFCRHLQQVTRSLASHRAEQFDAREPVLASELAPGDSEEDPLDVQGRPLTPSPDPDASEAAREEVQRIQRLFENYPLASLILDGLREGMKGPEIQNLLEISKKEYETTLKWIRRKVRAIWPREGNDA